MAEQQSGLDEAVQVGTSAVSHIRSLRTFSLFAKSAKGAAVAGPLGAALSLAIANRHTILKILAALLAIPILAVLFILMLPGLIFGSLTDDTGALNDNDLIQKNLQSANQAIVEVLEECHDEVLAEVNAAIEALPEGDTAVITDPYANLIAVNANQLIAQFCASQEDFKNINTNQLKALIRENKEGLFSYTVSSEEVTVEAEEGSEPVTFIRHTYYIQYAGDTYFSDHVFHLDDEQKELASDYAENLTTFFGGSASGVAVANVSAEVEAYRSTVQRIAAQYGMSDYVELVLAVMMQESGGQGSDPMQASESGYNTRYPRTPGGITDPEYSIECGIQALRAVLTKAGCTGPTDLDRIKLALQGYNFGSAYIDWAMERYGGYTKENAAAYSDMMCSRPGWNYSVYGDKDYVDHVLRYYVIMSTGGNYPANGMQIPLYIQTEYSNIPYGSGSIADCGCGPTAFAMIASYLTDSAITPADAVAWCGNAYYSFGYGTKWSYFQAASDHFGCGTVTTTTDANTVLQSLSQGCPVISSQMPGLFTSGGHFIVLRGVTANGKVLVNDPNDSDQKNYVNRKFDMMTEIHATSRQYWIFPAK